MTRALSPAIMEWSNHESGEGIHCDHHFLAAIQASFVLNSCQIVALDAHVEVNYDS